jgi:hypothetical protein
MEEDRNDVQLDQGVFKSLTVSAVMLRTKQQVLREQRMMGQEDTYTRHLDESRCQQNRQCILQTVHRALVDHFDTDQVKVHVQ